MLETSGFNEIKKRGYSSVLTFFIPARIREEKE
jgi:hypothetical protein